jgi:hypothetical protein
MGTLGTGDRAGVDNLSGSLGHLNDSDDTSDTTDTGDTLFLAARSYEPTFVTAPSEAEETSAAYLAKTPDL